MNAAWALVAFLVPSGEICCECGRTLIDRPFWVTRHFLRRTVRDWHWRKWCYGCREWR